jgi:hypothetical protein
MSNLTNKEDQDDDLMGYAKRHLLEHCYQAGWTDAQVEEKIANLPADNPYRSHFVSQYVERLPKDKRQAAQKRLEPKFDISEIA